MSSVFGLGLDSNPIQRRTYIHDVFPLLFHASCRHPDPRPGPRSKAPPAILQYALITNQPDPSNRDTRVFPLSLQLHMHRTPFGHGFRIVFPD